VQGTFGALFQSLSGGAGREKKGGKATPPARKARRDLEGIEDLEPEPVPLRMRRDICSEFADAPDFCMSTGLPAFSKSIIFFKRDFFMVIGGFIPITLGFSIGGEFNVMIQLDFCLLTLKVSDFCFYSQMWDMHACMHARTTCFCLIMCLTLTSGHCDTHSWGCLHI